MQAMLAAQTWRCDEALTNRFQGKCGCSDGWAVGKCRNCNRTNDSFGHKIGVMGGVYLEEGACPNCGTTPPPVELCHVCGGPASPGDYDESLGIWETGPEPADVSVLLDLALRHLELEPDEGRLPRRELDRLMARLYGRKFSRRLPYVRESWRYLLGQYLSGAALGERLAMEEAHDKAAKS